MIRRCCSVLLLLALLLLPAARAEAPAETPRPARGYVLVQSAGVSGWLPLPATEAESYSFPIRQRDQYGGLVENVLRLTPEGVYMESATCENHDCIEQGIVTLENRQTRPLMNYILCLPNQVSVALYTPEEVLALFGK